MLPPHMDVIVPPLLRSRLGHLLGDFEGHVQRSGYITRRRDKEPGGHVTSWWLYVQLDAQAPAKGEVQYGETDFARVNPSPHLWTRAREGYRKKALKLLQDFIAAAEEKAMLLSPPLRPVPRPFKVALATFEPAEYGANYLALSAGDYVEEIGAPEPGEGWAYGRIVSTDGERSEPAWYPPSFVR